MKRLLLVTGALMLALACSGCNTVHGMGQDLQKAGEKIQDATKKK
ncbi:MAG: entericidin A/B family lipoprotein [Rhodoferax sp.]|jgi:predicted small secreted protein|nr:entericidin A/B family lipoprotein [Xanthomonadales bacterium]MCP5282760.1 entericidin A/B family lipoprotein [Rhodoferax sp.]